MASVDTAAEDEKASLGDDTKHLILYDGDCGFCNRMVVFIHNKDDKRQFYFAPTFGEVATQLGIEVPRSETTSREDTMILVENWEPSFTKESEFTPLSRTDAVWRTMQILNKRPYSTIAWMMSKTPRVIAELGYKEGARVRRSILSLKEACTLVPPEDRKHFLK